MDADKAYTLFMNIILKLYDNKFPLISRKRREINKKERTKKKLWVTNKMLRLIKKNNKCFKIFCQTRRTGDEKKI